MSLDKNIVLKGKKTYLRPLQSTDLTEEYLNWINDPEVNKYLEVRHKKQTIDTLKGFYDQINSSEDSIIFAIIDNETKKHIGNIKLGPINWQHKNAVLGLMIGDKNFWRKGLGTEAVKLLLGYSFDILGLHKLSLGLIAENNIAFKLYKKVGFKEEGHMKEECFFEGKFHEKIIMSIFKKEYKG